MIDYFLASALRTMWYATLFLVWVIKAFFVAVAAVSNRRR